MEYILYFETWIVLAILFSCLEIFIPGGILLNLGIASLLVAIGVQQHILDTWALTLTAWFICASLLLFVLYFFTERFFKGDQTIGNVYEELDIYGKKVVVTEDIGPGTHAGRVSFQGTSWAALGDGSQIPAGCEAIIICKDNISLVVEPVK
ncbi:NfeD family protein [Thalassotalea sediminis]|uniref:NfeD family protein n=1 Tax=Thalassotalea sediminis TaxID=1759089 RepID=UPI002573A30B|nr:NfeD family protein [Thalassotalea sediminis]